MSTQSNALQEYFRNNTGRLMHKWEHYFEIYDAHFRRFRGLNPNILEIGCYHGGSLEMWRAYFGKGSRVYGVDIEPACKSLEAEQIKIHIGDQADRKFLKTLKTKLPPLHILIDDGGHTMKQQINTFTEMYSHLVENGIYVCEDLHTSYWSEFDGGYRRPGTFIECAKALIDALNAHHSRNHDVLAPTEFTRTAHSLHFYDSMLVIEKRLRQSPPISYVSGAPVPGLIEPLKDA